MARRVSHKDERHDYFSAKKAKLSEQFVEDYKESSEKPPQIFLGIRVYVNGYTVPPAEELKSMIVKHGGIYSVFLDSAVTHMVANNLPDSKLKVLQKVRVVRPEWIIDSIKEMKLLNCSEYLTYNSAKYNKNIWTTMKDERSASYSLEKEPSPLMMAVKDVVHTNSDASLKDPQPLKKGNTAGADVNSFHSRSRLHFLSTMKMELRSKMANLKKEENHSFSGLEGLKTKFNEKQNDRKMSQFQLMDDVIGESCNRVVIHIDMDCFFVSVSRIGRPELEGKPVVVTSSKMANFGGPFNVIKDSMADIASCSYEARSAGVRNGMRMGRALQICPTLVAVPYEFEKYRNVSYAFYEIVSSYTLDIEAVSCDELYIDCKRVLAEANCTPVEFAEHLQKEIMIKTGCSASVGIGSNRIQARVATKKAKPKGIYYLLPENVSSFMKDLPVQDLPGVGPSLRERLNELNIFRCEQLYSYGQSKLEKEFGPATGKSLYMHCQGLDSFLIENSTTLERKSVSSEMNYAIRFTEMAEAEVTLANLSKLVSEKLGTLKGKSVNLKLKIRSPDAPVVSAKYLGHGICDNYCRALTLAQPTSDSDVIYRAAVDLLKKSKVLVTDIRGIGIMMNKLEEPSSNQVKNNIKEFFKHNQKESVQEKKINEKYAVSRKEPIERNLKLQAGKKSDGIHRKEEPRKKPVTTKSSLPLPSGLDKSYEITSFDGCDPEKLVKDEFKLSFTNGKAPDKALKDRIMSLLLNELIQLNISFVSNFLTELHRQATKYVEDPNTLRIWCMMINSIKKAVLKDISKVINHPVKDFSDYAGINF